MQILDFEWNERNIEHIARHQVTPDEAEEACKNCPFILKGRQGYYIVHGRTLIGRYLLVIILRLGNGLVRVVTARDMTRREQRLYQERM